MINCAIPAEKSDEIKVVLCGRDATDVTEVPLCARLLFAGYEEVQPRVSHCVE